MNRFPADESVRIRRASSEQEIAAIRRLFTEFAESLDFDLGFQDFAKELAGLPGYYGPPSGELFLANLGDSPAGCVALRSLDESTCEMKRLWVRPAYRGTGLGRLLAEKIIFAAIERNYQVMKLDTVAEMKSAIRIYRSLGFEETEPYTFNPLPTAMYFERKLQ